MNFQFKRDIRNQIRNAFECTPNIAGTIHGVRRIPQGQRGKSTSLFPSRKAGGAIPLESRLELAHAISLERNSEVANYRTQALSINLPGNRSAFPDFLVRKSNGDIEIHEVKPSYENLKPEEQEKIEMIKEIFGGIGFKYEVFDSTRLLSRRQVERLLALYSHGHVWQWSDQQKRISLQLLLDKSFESLSDAYKVLSCNDLPIQLASFHLFYGRYSVSSNVGEVEVDNV